jgi:hypothetical protein
VSLQIRPLGPGRRADGTVEDDLAMAKVLAKIAD